MLKKIKFWTAAAMNQQYFNLRNIYDSCSETDKFVTAPTNTSVVVAKILFRI